MASRRTTYDCLQPAREMRWLEILDQYGRLMEHRALAPGTDLKRIFIASMLEHIDAGWQLSEFSSRSSAFFCNRGNERRQVFVVAVQPGVHPGYGAAHLVWSPGMDRE